MGNDASKVKEENQPHLLKGKDVKIKIDKDNLPKITMVELNVQRPPPIKTKSVLKKEAEQEALKGLEKFNLKDEYDLSTYQGRFKQQIARLNPLLFFTTDQKIAEAQDVLFKYKVREEVASKMGQPIMMKPEQIIEVKRADKLVGGAVHPDTNEIIPFYMRLNGFVVFNCPILLVSLFTRNQTPMFNAGMQLVNQTYNAGMNYGNRNASSTYTVSDLMRGYSGAVITSMSIALISRMMLAQRLAALSGARLILASACLNYFAAAFAGTANVALMRFKELQEGINIQDESGQVTFGKSKVAGQRAIFETSISRFVLPFPVLFFPALMNYLMERARIWPKNSVLSKLTEASLCICSLTFALPMSIALFQQRSQISSEELEMEFKAIKNEQGDLIKEFYYNKGM